MLSKSTSFNPQSPNISFKFSGAITLFAMSIMGITAPTLQIFSQHNFNQELNLTKPGKVIISRYEETDPTTGEVISVSRIKNR